MRVSACVWSGEGGERTWWIECTAKLSSNDLGSNLGLFFFFFFCRGEAVECTAKLSSNDRGSNLATTDCFFAEVKLLILTEDLKSMVWFDGWSSLRSRQQQKTQRVVC